VDVFIAGKAREAGINTLEENVGAASGLRREPDGTGFKQNAPGKKH
jgi:hypothetical protein